MRPCNRRKLISYLVPMLVVLVVIAAGSSGGAFAGELGDAFVPIKDSTSADPAGFQLMIISIGILVTMVLSIFTVTIVYMTKSKSKPVPRAADNIE